MSEVKETAKIRVKVIGSGKEGDPFCVNLPTYNMVPGSWLPLIPGRIDKDGVRILDDAKKPVVLTADEKSNLTCEVEVPDDLVDAQGRLDKAKIRVKYKGQPLWDRDDVLSDV